MKNLRYLCAATLLAFSGLASATVTNWGVHAPVEVASNFVAPGFFADIYAFGLSSDTMLYSSAVSDNLGPAVQVDYGAVALFQGVWDGNLADDTLVGGYAFDGTTGDIVHSAGVGPGYYFYAVYGTAVGSAGGAYLMESAAVSVPEPESYGLLFLGLGAVVAGARWRGRA